MNSRELLVEKLHKEKLIAIVRLNDSSGLIKIAESLQQAGVLFLEVTLTMPNPFAAIEAIKKAISGEFYVGAGTVKNLDLAKRSIDCGADFLVSPNFKLEVVELAHKNDLAVMSGALTPTEIYEAWESGSDAVKIFPSSLGGPKYFKELSGPFPDIRLMPTGSITLESAPEYLKAGAFALGVGTSLVNPGDVAAGNYEQISQSATEFRRIISNFESTK
jgi:2-dehydro-3-deoxyphosphogluconate aldolase/(4S)-4-hydroxy-2-oxoglutarate aldolase